MSKIVLDLSFVTPSIRGYGFFYPSNLPSDEIDGQVTCDARELQGADGKNEETEKRIAAALQRDIHK